MLKIQVVRGSGSELSLVLYAAYTVNGTEHSASLHDWSYGEQERFIFNVTAKSHKELENGVKEQIMKYIETYFMESILELVTSGNEFALYTVPGHGKVSPIIHDASFVKEVAGGNGKNGNKSCGTLVITIKESDVRTCAMQQRTKVKT